jgi:TolA-binding protein
VTDGAASGRLLPGALPQVLRDLYVHRRSGLLHLTRDGTAQGAADGVERRSVRFRLGHIVHAQSNVPEERMGAALVRRGLITETDLERATLLVKSTQLRLGQVLEEMNLVHRDSLEDVLAFQVQDVLAKVFAWTDGGYAFEPESSEASMAAGVVLKMSTGDLVLQAARSVTEPAVVRAALGDMDRPLALSSDPLLRFQRLSLGPSDGYLLSRVDGNLTANDVVALVPLPPEEVHQSLFGLVCTGVIDFLQAREAPARPRPAAAIAPPPPPVVRSRAAAPAPAPAAAAPLPPPSTAAPAAAGSGTVATRDEILEAHGALGKRTHFEVLGVERSASQREVEQAFHRLARRYHPDAHHDRALADLRDKLVAVFVRLGEAHQTLRDPQRRASYERMLGPAPRVASPAGAGASQTAEAAAQAAVPEADPALWVKRATQLITEKQYWDAIQLLDEAMPRLEGKLRNRARLLLATAYSKNPKWLREAETVLLELVKDEPKNAEAHYLLGTIYSRSLKARAAAMFDKALELNPDHKRAREERDLLGDQPATADPRARNVRRGP